MPETKISPLSHFKNLALIILLVNILPLISIIPSISIPIKSYFYNFPVVIIYFLIFRFGKCLFSAQVSRLEANNLLFCYTNIATVILKVLTFHLYLAHLLVVGFAVLNLGFMMTVVFVVISILSYLFDFLLIWLIWRYFDLKIRNEIKLTEK